MDLYEVLGLSKTASLEEIKKSYRSLAIKWHPDTNPNNITKATEMFLKINEAYTVLRDSEKRKQYDESLNQSYNSDFSRSQENAYQVFIEEMYRVAAEYSFTNNEANFIVQKLMEIGCSQEVAATIAVQSVDYRKSTVRQQAKKPFFKSLAWLMVGLLVTIFSGNVIAWGAVLFGGYNMFVALYHLITGNTALKNPYGKESKKAILIKWSVISVGFILILSILGTVANNDAQKSTQLSKDTAIYNEKSIKFKNDFTDLRNMEIEAKNKKSDIDSEKAELDQLSSDVKSTESNYPNGGIPDNIYTEYQSNIDKYNSLLIVYDNNISSYNLALNDYSNKVDIYNKNINDLNVFAKKSGIPLK
jgi:hypothetical protein